MAASNPQGEMVFGDNGFPFQGILFGSRDAGEMVFGSNGFPFQYQFPPAAGGSSIKTFLGLARASTKTVNGLALASLKTFNGLTNI